MRSINIKTSNEIIDQFRDAMSSGNGMTITNLTAIHVSVERKDDLIVVMLLSGTAGSEGSHGIAFTVRSDVTVQLLTQLTCALLRLQCNQDDLEKLEKLDEPIKMEFHGKYLEPGLFMNLRVKGKVGG